MLRYWVELSEAEVAATLNIAVGTVKSRTNRGLRALEAALAPSESAAFPGGLK